LFGPATALTVITAVALWFTHREDDEVKQRKNLEKKDKLTINKLFKSILRELKERGQYKQKYRLPWYLFISHNLQTDAAVLSQMGFKHSSVINLDHELAVQIWLKNNAVMIAVDLSKNDYRVLNCTKLLLRKVKNFRSRQALNGILLSQSIERLLNQDKSANQQLANESRLVIEDAQKLCGQKLPLYVLFNQMANLADFCQFFSSLEESQLDGCFGAVNNPPIHAESFTLPWFNTAFDDLCHRMGKAVVFAIDNQLNESFRRSVIAAPVQFRQIKSDISLYLSELLLSKKTAHEYHFRGMFFTNTENNATVNDLLTKQMAYQLDQGEMLIPDGMKMSHSLFIAELFNRFIRPEAGVAQINKLGKRLHFTFQASYFAFILSVLGLTAGLIKVNFNYYQSLNAAALVQLDAYKKEVQKSPYQSESLIDNVINLHQLRSIYGAYKQPTPAYISQLVPNPSLFQAVEKSYHTELLNVLVPSLVNDIDAKLKSNQESGDILQTANLLTLAEYLEGHSSTDWQALKKYYKQSFDLNNTVDKATIADLMALMDDLYLLGIPEIEVNQKLVAKAKSMLNTVNRSQVIFNYIKTLPQFSSVVDIEDELGAKFFQLFQVKDNSMLRVPTIYTPQGYSALNLHASSPLIKDMVTGKKSLLGEELNDFEVNNLVQQLQRLYQRAYISYWRGFIDNLTFKPTSTVDLANTLDLLATNKEAPLSQLYDVIGYYTHPSLQSTESQPKKDKVTDKETALLLDKKSEIAIPSSAQRLMEKTIQAKFSVYRDFIKVDENGISKLSNLVTQFAKVKKWLDKSNKSNEIAVEYLHQLSAADKDQSLYQLSEMMVEIELLEDYKSELISIISEDIRQSVVSYLEKQWQQKMYSPFSTLFANKFPFNIASETSITLKEFNRYFKIDGIFNTYTVKLFNGFKQVEGLVYLNTFIPNEAIYVKSETLAQLALLAEMQQVLYRGGKSQISIPFKVNVKSMSENLLKFEFFSQRTLMTYQHGPKLWQDFVWPDLTNQSALLAIFTDTKGQKNTLNFTGDWAWLRLIYQNSQNQTEVVLGKDNKDIRLLLRVESDSNPLSPQFFSQFKPPKQLLK
jgi:type VI protein secretion system component VasK